MKALILNSGMGKRMGSLTSTQPKCMTEISDTDTILSRQLKILSKNYIKDIVMTTGFYDTILIEYCNSLQLDLNYTFINNTEYDNTNYIYSMFLAREYLNDNILLMHGDLVFSDEVLNKVALFNGSCMTISTTLPLPQKDFKAVLNYKKNNTLIEKIGIEFFDNAVAAQPFYKLNKSDLKEWLSKIEEYCYNKQTSCYAENALNEVLDKCLLYPLDINDSLCNEIDTIDDLAIIKRRLEEEHE